MFAIAFLAWQLATSQLWNTPLQDGERMVVLSDAMRFGIEPTQARQLWLLSSTHSEKMRPLMQCNHSAIIARWEEECKFRARAWFLIDDVMYHYKDLHAKLVSLEALRVLLGDDAFFRGEIPAPTPQYRMGK